MIKINKILMVLICSMVLIIGCFSYKNHIQRGSNEMILGFHQLPSLQEPIEIKLSKPLVVRINRNKDDFTICNNTRGIFGCAGVSKNGYRIEVHGKLSLDGKIVLEPSSLGHEFWHILSWETKGIVKNPDFIK